MNIAETLKHLGNHWELYCLVKRKEFERFISENIET